MNESELKEFLFSLSWAYWSAYHTMNAQGIIKKNWPNLNEKELISAFCNVIGSKPGEGSPK